MIFGLFTSRVRTDRRAPRRAVPGARRLAISGSAAGVVVVAAGVAILAAGGGHVPTRTAAHAHVGAAAATHLTGPLAHSRGAHIAYPPAAYPPHNPCSLELVRPPGSSAATVEGSGLGPDQTVTIAFYAGSGSVATTLGSYRVDGSGSFVASVDVPTTSNAHAVLTARSPSAQCVTPAGAGRGYPPTTNPTTGPITSRPPGGGSTPPVTSGPTSSGPTSSAPTTSTPTTSTTGSSAGSTGAAPTTGSGSSASQGANGGGTSSSGAGPSGTTSSGSTSSGATPSGTTSSGSNGAGPSSVTPAPTPSTTATPAAIGAQSWGLPTSFIVTMALVLLVLGGLAVLVLTRRSG